METACTFAWTPGEPFDVTATDLRNAAYRGSIAETLVNEETGREHVPFGTTMQTFKIAVCDRGGRELNGAEGVVLWTPDGCRIGLAWGGDADWGRFGFDGHSNDEPAFAAEVEACIGDWLKDEAAWAARSLAR